MQKLGNNHDGYHGETIDIGSVLREIAQAAHSHGWASEIFGEDAGFDLSALCRHPASLRTPRPAPRVYISAGIHGDEPAGPLAMLRLLRENRWPAGREIFLVPCLNPAGFTLNRRENADGIDLNRDYRNPRSAGIRAHIAWLERQPQFDYYLCLHEDWEAHGFYLYEQNPDSRPPLGEKIIAAMKDACPVDTSASIEGRTAQNGVIRPITTSLQRPDWPEAFYLIHHKSRQGCTLEAPSDYPMETRINGLVAAVNAAINL